MLRQPSVFHLLGALTSVKFASLVTTHNNANNGFAHGLHLYTCPPLGALHPL
jgi:hypothetical protein